VPRSEALIEFSEAKGGYMLLFFGARRPNFMGISYSAAIAWAISICTILIAAPAAHGGVSCYSKSSYSTNLIVAVQETLAKEGFAPGGADGKWGPKTTRALEAFQRQKHLPVTADLNASTMRALFGPSASAEQYGLIANPDLPPSIFATDCR
jgi:hypothetical protein